MNPQITPIVLNQQGLSFTLSGVDVSVANAIRRTILSQIDRLTLGNVVVEENTSAQFHNEIIKHRLQSIPVIMDLRTVEEMEDFCDKYYIEIDVHNTTEAKMYVTTEHIQILERNAEENSNRKGSVPDARVVFPPYKTHYYIDLLRLYPGKGETIPGERLKLTADFQIHRANENSCYTVASKCAYYNTVDMGKAMDAWTKLEKAGINDGWTADIVALKKRDFLALDADRYYKPNSFDFTVRSIGIYEENDLVFRACGLIVRTLEQLKVNIEADAVHMYPSTESTMENAWDIVLKNGTSISKGIEEEENVNAWRKNTMHDGHSIGTILDHLMYRDYVEGKKTVTYSGFAKFHPHNKDSVLRVALRSSDDIQTALKSYLVNCCDQAIQVFKRVEPFFGKNAP